MFFDTPTLLGKIDSASIHTPVFPVDTYVGDAKPYDVVAPFYVLISHSYLIQGFCSGLNFLIVVCFVYRVSQKERTLWDFLNLVSMVFVYPVVEYVHHLERQVMYAEDRVWKLQVIAYIHAFLAFALPFGALVSYLALRQSRSSTKLTFKKN